MKVKIDGKEVRLPDFLIVGAARSGTTSLYSYLKQHPQIFMPENKEPWFFTFAEMPRSDLIFSNKGLIDVITDFNDYLKLFKDARDMQVLGEASTIYLYLYTETIKNIKKHIPQWKELKIVIILRNPIERAFSHYSLTIASGTQNLSFEDAIERCRLGQIAKHHNYIDYGFYYSQVKSYLENFNQVKICLFEDLAVNLPLLVQNLYKFLEVDASFMPDINSKHNVSLGGGKLITKFIYEQNIYKKLFKKVFSVEMRQRMRNKLLNTLFPRKYLGNSDRQKLKEIYKEDILKLQNLIHRDLSHWLK